VLAERAAAEGSMAGRGETGEAGASRGGDGGKSSNPFKMPSDEEIFSLRHDERGRLEEEVEDDKCRSLDCRVPSPSRVTARGAHCSYSLELFAFPFT